MRCVHRDANGRVPLIPRKAAILRTALNAQSWYSPALRERAADSLSIALAVDDVRAGPEADAYLKHWKEAQEGSVTREHQLAVINAEQLSGYEDDGRGAGDGRS